MNSSQFWKILHKWSEADLHIDEFHEAMWDLMESYDESANAIEYYLEKNHYDGVC